MTGAGLVFQRWKAARPSDCYLCHGEDGHRHNRCTQTSAATEEAQGAGGAPRGHFARLAPWWAKAWAESQQETGLSRKQHQEQVRRGSSSDCRKTGGRERVWLISGTAELLGEATQRPLYIHLPLPPLVGFDSDLIPHCYEQRLKCKPELSRVIRNEKLVDGYLLEMKAETFYSISWKNMILLSWGVKLPLGFKQQNNCLLLWFLFFSYLKEFILMFSTNYRVVGKVNHTGKFQSS